MNVFKRRATNSLNFVHSDTGGGCEVRFAPYIQRHPKNSASYPGHYPSYQRRLATECDRAIV